MSLTCTWLGWSITANLTEKLSRDSDVIALQKPSKQAIGEPPQEWHYCLITINSNHWSVLFLKFSYGLDRSSQRKPIPISCEIELSVRERELEKRISITKCESRLLGKTFRLKRGWSGIRHRDYAMEGAVDSYRGEQRKQDSY